MLPSAEDIENSGEYHIIKEIPYSDLLPFVLENLGRRTAVMFIFWALCALMLLAAVVFRISYHSSYSFATFFIHSLAGIVILPLLVIPVHEGFHIIPYRIGGARTIRIGMDLKQFIFYVTAHRFVASPLLFIIVALTPFLVISVAVTLIIFLLPGPWQWSFILFLFFHTTMCAGDFALINFYWLNRDKRIYTWDDADKKIAYFACSPVNIPDEKETETGSIQAGERTEPV